MEQVTKPTLWRRGIQILEGVYGDVDPLKRAKGQEWRKPGRAAPRRRESMREKEEVLPPMRIEDFRHAARIKKSTTAGGSTQSHHWISRNKDVE